MTHSDLETAKVIISIGKNSHGGPPSASNVLWAGRVIARRLAELERQHELLVLNLCPTSVRYGRTCDEGPTDEEIGAFLAAD